MRRLPGGLSVRIAIPELLITLREQLHHEPGSKGRLESWAYRLWAAVIGRPRLYGWATWLASRTAGRMLGKRWLRRLPGPLSGWTAARDFPAPAPRRFRDWWREEQA